MADQAIEAAKKKAARQAVDDFVKNHQRIGVGSGTTIVYAIERIVEKKLDLVCVPTSSKTSKIIQEKGLKLGSLSDNPVLDVAIDGADEVDSHLNLIKGGGGAHTREKIVASCAKQFVVIADYRKDSMVLGQQWKKGVPIEVIPMAQVPVSKRIEGIRGKPVLRMSENKEKPLETDNGNLLIDADFGEIEDPEELEKQIRSIPGVVEVGLFCRMAIRAYFGNADGTVTVRERK